MAVTTGMSQAMQTEIKRKAVAGIKMDSPTTAKTALYNSFLPKAPATTSTTGMSQGMQTEIKRKAVAGIKMDSPTAAKTALYNSFLPKAPAKTPATTGVTKPTGYTDIGIITLKQIQAAAKNNKSLSNPSQSKNALYNYYKANPNAKITEGLSGSWLDEVQRKSTGGINLDKPNPLASSLYNSFKAPVKAYIPPPPVYDDVSQYLDSGEPTQVRDESGMVGPTDNGQANWNSNQSIPDYGQMTPGMIEQILAGYSGGGKQYDPETDPVYQSMMLLANKQADSAGLSTMEDMNERGILNSTVTSDRVGQIKQGASDAVLGAIPGLSANFQNQQSNNQAGMQNLLSTVLGAGQFQQSFGEDNRRFDKGFSLDEAEITGRYLPPEAQGILESVMNAKKANSMKSSPEDRAKAAAQAATGYQQLSMMGFDISGINGNVTYSDAMKNMSALGRNTLPQQKMDLDKTAIMGRQVDTTAQGLISQVLTAKKANENKEGNRIANGNIANDARAQLQAMGFDTSGIGGNVKYAQAEANARNLGANTLSRDSLNNDARQSNADRAFSKDVFNREQAFKENSFDRTQDFTEDSFDRTQDFTEDSFDRDMTFKEDSFDRDMTFQEENAKMQNDLASRGLDIDSLRVQIDDFNSKSDAEYKQYQKEAGLSDTQAQQNTNNAIGEALSAPSAADALAYFSANVSSWKNSGVDIREVIDAINDRWQEAQVVTDKDASTSGFFDTP